tara:strand:- start:306 stop:461 length:156 start_codon:yes stop_codon:yes gene_type:complete
VAQNGGSTEFENIWEKPNIQFKVYLIDLTFDFKWSQGQVIALMLVSLEVLP